MPKNEKTVARSSSNGEFLPSKPGKPGPTKKSLAGSALSQNLHEASPRSRSVIKEVSNEHRNALKRLVDR